MEIPASPFDLNKSHLTTEKLSGWQSKVLTGDLNEVPSIGPKTIEKLNKVGIFNTWQLIGDMLKHVAGTFDTKQAINRFGNTYWNRLVVDFASPAQHAHTVIHALVEKVSSGLSLPGVPMPQSAITNEQWTKLAKMKNRNGKYILTGNIADDIFYIGPEYAKKLGDDSGIDNIKNTWQLVGLFLEFYTGDADKDLAAFEAKLKTYEIRRVRDIAAQLVEIIGSGIQLRNDLDDDEEEKGPIRRNIGKELDDQADQVKETPQRPSTSTVSKPKKKSSSLVSTAVMAVIALVLLLFIKNKLGL